MASPFDNNPQLQYDLREAQIAGLSEADIAQYAAGRRNYDYEGARRAGLSDADIIRHNIANVSEAGGWGAFTQEAVPAALTAPAVGYGMAKGFQAGLALPIPYLPARFGAAILGALAGGAIPATIGASVTEEVKERAGLGGQYVPSAQKGALAGETFGFVSGFGLPTVARGAAAKLAGTKLGSALGVKPLGPQVALAGDDIFLQTGAKPVDLGSSLFLQSAVSNPGMSQGFGRWLKKAEGKLTTSRARRLAGPGSALAFDVGIAGGAALGRGAAEAADPGNVLLGVAGEILGGMFNTASLLNMAGGSLKNLGSRAWGVVQPGAAADEGRVVKALQRMVDDIDDAIVAGAPTDPKTGLPDKKAVEHIRINTQNIIDELEAADPAIFGALDPKTGGWVGGAGRPPKLNAAEKTNSQLMRLLGATLMGLRGGSETEALKRGVVAQSQEFMEDMGAILDNLSLIENPALMSEVSLAKENTFKKLLEGVLNAHTLKAIDIANKIGSRGEARRKTLQVTGATPEDTRFIAGGEFFSSPTDAAQTIINTVTRASDESRKIENALWKQVDKKIEVPINNIIKFWDEKTNPEVGGTEAAEKLYIPFVKQWINERKAPLEEALAPLRKRRDVLQKDITKASKNLESAKKRLAKKPDDVYTQRQVERYEDILKEGGYPKYGGETGRQRLNRIQAEIDELERGAKATMGQLQEFRSQMLLNSRVKDPTTAGAAQPGFYSKMAEKALDDMAPEDNPNLNLTGAQRIKYNNARAFSRAFNDVFTRAYGGELLRTQATGADRLTPEQLANQLITSAGNETAARFTQLNNAMDFIIQRQPDPTLKAEMRALKKYDLRGATDIILRDILSKKVIDPVTDQIRPAPLARALRDYEEVFQVPGMNRVKLDLQDAKKAQLYLNRVKRDVRKAGYTPEAEGIPGDVRIEVTGPRRKGSFEVPLIAQRGKDIDAFRVFLDNQENPTQEILTLKKTTNPERAFRGLIQLVRSGNREVKGNAVEGLRQVIMDAAVENSRRTAAGPLRGTIDFFKFNEFLNTPLGVGKKSISLRELLKNEKVITDQEFNDLATLTDYGQRTERFLQGGDDPDQIIDDILHSGSLLVAAAGRAAGATFFSKALDRLYGAIGIGGVRNAALVEAQLGATLAGKYLDQLPGQAMEAILFESFKDPKKMAALMKKIRNPADVRRFHGMQRPILESIIGLEGYREISERIADDRFFEEETETVEPMPVAQAPTPRPSAPLVDPTPAPLPVAPTPPPPAPRQEPVASPSTRSQYAAMFPYDTASEIIRGQEGIASLV